MPEQHTEETWSTHQMRVTLANTASLYWDARSAAQQDPTGRKLSQWVTTWFRGDLSHLNRTDQDAVTWLRDNMDDAEWHEIDWKSVAEDLAAD